MAPVSHTCYFIKICTLRNLFISLKCIKAANSRRLSSPIDNDSTSGPTELSTWKLIKYKENYLSFKFLPNSTKALSGIQINITWTVCRPFSGQLSYKGSEPSSFLSKQILDEKQHHLLRIIWSLVIYYKINVCFFISIIRSLLTSKQ